VVTTYRRRSFGAIAQLVHETTTGTAVGSGTTPNVPVTVHVGYVRREWWPFNGRETNVGKTIV